ncbi:MAG: aminoglycoside phosphotransferase family protein [Acidimicrobiia bacterium]
MTDASARLSDPGLPEVSLLLGPDALGPLRVALAGAGASLGRVRPRQVTWWPGRSITVRFEAFSEFGPPLPQIMACAGSIPDGAAILEADDLRIGVWALPNDPGLPGLASILDPRTLRPMLESLGITVSGISTRLRAYRPGRRAVVQVDTDRTRLFVKLGRPQTIRALHQTHRLMSEVLPVPESLGFDPDLGILVMPSGVGQTLREVLDGGRATPDPAAFEALLVAMPPPVGSPRPRSPITRLDSLTNLLRAVVPDQTARLDDLVGRIGSESDNATVPVHGDFHDGQVLVDGGRITGLLDVDTHGVGHPADDPATMLGHLESRRTHSPRPDGIAALTAALVDVWCGRVDAVELRRRTSAVMLGLATGPFRVQQDGWPDGVRDRIRRADEVMRDENPLIPITGSSHARPAQ